MRPFLLESVFWQSLAHTILRALRLSHTRAFSVIICAYPLSLPPTRPALTSELPDEGEELDQGPSGFYTTHIVLADSAEEAEMAALAHTRTLVRSMLGEACSGVRYEVSEIVTREGVVWHQRRGCSFFPCEEWSASSGGA